MASSPVLAARRLFVGPVPFVHADATHCVHHGVVPRRKARGLRVERALLKKVLLVRDQARRSPPRRRAGACLGAPRQSSGRDVSRRRIFSPALSSRFIHDATRAVLELPQKTLLEVQGHVLVSLAAPR